MRPHYVEVPLLGGGGGAALYQYVEGGRGGARAAPPERCKLAVLFVHGNDGSHAQVRSIASVTAASPHGGGGVHFYTIAVSAGFTGMDGADLLEQSGLVTDALRTLASRHRRTRAQLAVLAHSMGGVAALHALGGTGGATRTHMHGMHSMDMDMRMHMPVAAVIGLGVPFRAPPLRASRALDGVYTAAMGRGAGQGAGRGADRGAGWLREAAAEDGGGGDGGDDDAMPAWVSICGGDIDWMVAPPLCRLDGVLPAAAHALSVLSTDLDLVWAEVEHQPLLWCNQLTRRVSAALLSLAALVPPADYHPIVPPGATTTTTAATTAASAATSAAPDPNASAVPLWAPPVPLRRRVAALRAILLPRAPALLRWPSTPALSPRDADADADASDAAAAADAASDATYADAAAAALCAEKGHRTVTTEGDAEGLRWLGAGETVRWRWADGGASADGAVGGGEAVGGEAAGGEAVGSEVVGGEAWAEIDVCAGGCGARLVVALCGAGGAVSLTHLVAHVPSPSPSPGGGVVDSGVLQLLRLRRSDLAAISPTSGFGRGWLSVVVRVELEPPAAAAARGREGDPLFASARQCVERPGGGGNGGSGGGGGGGSGGVAPWAVVQAARGGGGVTRLELGGTPRWWWLPWRREVASTLPRRLLSELCLSPREGACDAGGGGGGGGETVCGSDRDCGGSGGSGGAQDEVMHLVLDAVDSGGGGGGEPMTSLRGGAAAAAAAAAAADAEEGRLSRLLGGSALAVTLSSRSSWQPAYSRVGMHAAGADIYVAAGSCTRLLLLSDPTGASHLRARARTAPLATARAALRVRPIALLDATACCLLLAAAAALLASSSAAGTTMAGVVPRRAAAGRPATAARPLTWRRLSICVAAALTLCARVPPPLPQPPPSPPCPHLPLASLSESGSESVLQAAQWLLGSAAAAAMLGLSGTLLCLLSILALVRVRFSAVAGRLCRRRSPPPAALPPATPSPAAPPHATVRAFPSSALLSTGLLAIGLLTHPCLLLLLHTLTTAAARRRDRAHDCAHDRDLGQPSHPDRPDRPDPLDRPRRRRVGQRAAEAAEAAALALALVGAAALAPGLRTWVGRCAHARTAPALWYSADAREALLCLMPLLLLLLPQSSPLPPLPPPPAPPQAGAADAAGAAGAAGAAAGAAGAAGAAAGAAGAASADAAATTDAHTRDGWRLLAAALLAACAAVPCGSGGAGGGDVSAEGVLRRAVAGCLLLRLPGPF